MSEIIWSPYQEEVFKFIESGKGSAIVEAHAGSAKTTTLVEAARRLDEWSSAVVVAFNTRIKDELARRLPTNVQALTLNAMGFRAWKRFTDQQLEVDKFKTTNLVKEMSENNNVFFRKGVKQLVDLAKMAGIVPSFIPAKYPCEGLVPDEESVWADLIFEYGVDFGFNSNPNVEYAAIETARRVLGECIAQGSQSIDFNDQLYLPVVFNADFPQYDIVFVDEAQDISPIQRIMIERSLTPGGRLIAVGDPNQAIYHFRGAGANSMGDLQKKFDAVTLPLPICYRCSKAVIEQAQRFVPTIQSWHGAPEGLVEEWGRDWSAEEFVNTDVILCRLNAPLVKAAFRLLRAGKACKVVGRDIGSGLAALVKKMKAVSLSELKAKLDAFVQKESPTLNPDQLSSLLDRVETINVFAENCTSPQSILDRIEGMFADEAGQYLRLSTVHKAKGLEFPRVFILNSELIGARVKNPADSQAEQNIWYVAITRAQQELYFIHD